MSDQEYADAAPKVTAEERRRFEQIRAALAALRERAAGRERSASLWASKDGTAFAIGNDGTFSMRLGEGDAALTLTAEQTRHLYNFWGMICWGEILLIGEDRRRRGEL